MFTLFHRLNQVIKQVNNSNIRGRLHYSLMNVGNKTQRRRNEEEEEEEVEEEKEEEEEEEGLTDWLKAERATGDAV